MERLTKFMRSHDLLGPYCVSLDRFSKSFFCPLVSYAGLTKGLANGGMAEFQEVMRQQLESSMHTELEMLLDTATGAEKEVTLKHPLMPTYTHNHTHTYCPLS